ncbi:MAG: serine/threonine protein kinase [Nitrospirota bacterium]|nr:serine/threonine protein kinase [Nitrospirota bacterium]
MTIQQLKDEYEILGEIGSGGMATVLKARQKSLDRLVAIKQLKKSYHADAQIIKRFERESQVAASLQHENIVHIYDFWKRPNFAIVMEYVDGTDLAEILEKTGPLPVDVGIMIAIQVCNALDYAHMRGLVHRDIKPSNIMIKRNGEVKLMDFGIAHTRHMDALTMPGTLIGTPAYMSPEQILGQPLDIRSDLFSFGIVLYEMFTGVKPFTDEETRGVSAKIVKDEFLSPRRVNRDIPRALQRIIKKCLRKKPHRRFASMPDLERKLGKRLAGRTTKPASLLRIADYLVSRNVFEAAPEQETMIITGNRSGLGRRMKWAITAVSAILVASAGAAYYYRTMINHPAEPLLVLPEQSKPAPAVSAPTATTPVTAPSVTPASQATATPPPAPQAFAAPQTASSPTVVRKSRLPAAKKSTVPVKKKKPTAGSR